MCLFIYYMFAHHALFLPVSVNLRDGSRWEKLINWNLTLKAFLHWGALQVCCEINEKYSEIWLFCSLCLNFTYDIKFAESFECIDSTDPAIIKWMWSFLTKEDNENMSVEMFPKYFV